MKILSNKLVIVASVLSVLIVLVAHLVSQRLYNTESALEPTSTVSVPYRVFTDGGVNFDSANAYDQSVPDSISTDSNESPSASDGHDDAWDMSNPESGSRLTEEEREVAMRQIRIWEEKIKEAEAGLPPLMLTNPEQYLNEVLQHTDRLLARGENAKIEAERLMIEAENLLRRSPDKRDSVVPPQLPDPEPLFLRVGQLRRKVEEARSQTPEEPGFTIMMDDLESMEVVLEELERISETLNN